MFSVVIPSRNIDNLLACVKAIRAAAEVCEIIAVWDESVVLADTDEYEPKRRELDALDVLFWHAAPPFCFSKSANIGIRAAGQNDVILCNDDALLETMGGFSALAQYPVGVMSATVKGPAHPVHEYGRIAKSLKPGELQGASFVPFVCVLISRKCIEYVGLLDERFVPGSWEDNDYCRRVLMAGFQVGVYPGCVVNHGILPHTFRPENEAQKYELIANRRRYEDKWGLRP